MSNSLLNQVFAHSRAKGTARTMMIAIADALNDDGTFQPTIELLATKCGVRERNARYLLRQLEELGELKITPGYGRGNRSHYEITLEKGQSSAGFDEKEKGQNPVEKGQNCAQKGQNTAEKGAKIPRARITQLTQEKTQDTQDILPVATAPVATKVSGGTLFDLKPEVPTSQEPAQEKSGKQAKKSPEPKAERPRNELWDALQDVLGVEPKLYGQARFGADVKKLRDAEITPAQLYKFKEWWFRFDWRGQKGQSPKLTQIGETWQEAMRYETEAERKERIRRETARREAELNDHRTAPPLYDENKTFTPEQIRRATAIKTKLYGFDPIADTLAWIDSMGRAA